jgi:hypothetical protein
MVAVGIVGLLTLLVGVLGLVVGRELAKKGRDSDGIAGDEPSGEERT